MKNFKRTLTVVLAVAVLFALSSIAAFAANHTVSTDSTTHTYEIYQVFTGTYNSGELQNLKYGVNAVGTPGNAVSQTDMETLAGLGDMSDKTDQQKITAMKNFVDLTSTPIAEIGKGKESSASLAEGYYIVKDKDSSLQDPEQYTLYLFKVLNADLEIDPKSGTTESEKNIAESTPVKTGDYDIGSVIPYSLTLTLPDNYADFKDYYAKFVDDMSPGLTLNTDSVKIHYGESDTSGTAIELTAVSGTSYTGSPSGQKYEYEIADLKSVAKASGLGAGDTVTITYTATLNSNAVVGDDGNPNKFHVVYSNNPNNTGHGEGDTNETPDDTNVVFTFKTIFDKIDADENALTGADFKLEKKVGDNWVDVTSLHTGDGAVNPSKTGSTAGATFEFSGLGQGEYRLTEITTPTGYNTIDPITFTITAQYTVDGITSLTGTGTGITMTPNTSAGSLSANIVNQSGSTLPITGGMGTKIFMIAGLILIAGAAITLVVRRRMQSE